MPANDPTAYANAVQRVIVDYGREPAESWVRRLYGDVSARLRGVLVAPVLGADADPERTYGGRLEGVSVQDFQGAANPASTNVAYRDGGHATIASGIVEGPYGDPARRIFADRLRRRSPLT